MFINYENFTPKAKETIENIRNWLTSKDNQFKIEMSKDGVYLRFFIINKDNNSIFEHPRTIIRSLCCFNNINPKEIPDVIDFIEQKCYWQTNKNGE